MGWRASPVNSAASEAGGGVMADGLRADRAADMRDECTVTVHIPMHFRRKGGRKLVISPTGEQHAPSASRYIDDALLRSLVQAFEWKRQLDNGEYATIGELAATLKLNHSFVSRVLRLTLLAPDLVDAILNGRQAETIDRQKLLRSLPGGWAEQGV
jgi:hypothetical protein